MSRVTLGNLGRSLSAEKQRLYRVGHRGPSGSKHSRQSRASHGGDWPPFRGPDGHWSLTWYAGNVAETSPNTQCAFRQLWKKFGLEVHQQCVHVLAKLTHPPSSALSSPSG